MRLDGAGTVTIEIDMTNNGTGSYTIIAQTAAEMMGVPIEKLVVRLGRPFRCLPGPVVSSARTARPQAFTRRA